MNTSWRNALDDLGAAAQSLEAALFAWDELNDPDAPFIRERARHSIFVQSSRINWKKLFEIAGTASLYRLPDLFSGLLYYDTIFLPFPPCPRSHFYSYFHFQLDEMDLIRRYVNA